MRTALDRACFEAGGTQKLAHAINVSRQTLAAWKKKGVPVERAPDIERAVKGRVTRHDLRPDFDWGRAA